MLLAEKGAELWLCILQLLCLLCLLVSGARAWSEPGAWSAQVTQPHGSRGTIDTWEQDSVARKGLQSLILQCRAGLRAVCSLCLELVGI